MGPPGWVSEDLAGGCAPRVPAGRENARAAAPETGAMLRLNFRLLKWLAIVLPLLFLGVTDGARELLFADRLGSAGSRVFFFGVAAAGVAAFSQVIFVVVDRLENRIVRQNEYLAALNAIATSAAESPGPEELLRVALDQALAALRVEFGLICTVDLEHGEHSAVASRGFSEELIRSLQRSSIADDPIASEVVETGCPVVIERLLEDDRVAELAGREGIRSAISVPLKAHGEIVGIMAAASRTERGFAEADREFLSSVAGQLGVALQRADAFERSLQRNREMEALLTISGAVTSSLDLPHVLDRALETILEVTSADAAEIWLADEDELTLTRHRSAAPGRAGGAVWVQPGEGLPGRAFESRKPVLVRRGDPAGAARPGADFQTSCALPLIHKQDVLGVLAVSASADDALSRREELRLLAAVAEVLSVAIANARLYEQVQDTAVLEERERIAREMHDGLAQVLTYVNAQTLAIGKLIDTGRTEAARTELVKMEEAVRDVYADVREAILGLRASPGSAGGFFLSLRSYLDAYSEMTGMTMELRVADDVEATSLPSSTEIQLMRIIQEALANVRKHARAQTATVSFELARDGLCVRVEDDGRGFDPLGLLPRGWPRFGLQTMRERAAAIGGDFRIVSAPGGGSSIVIDLAIAQDGASLVAV